MDKCPSIVILGQTISDLLRHIFGEVHVSQRMCQMYINKQRKHKTTVDVLSTNDLCVAITCTTCVCVCVCVCVCCYLCVHACV